MELASLKNPGSACVARKVVEDVSVVNVFNVLGRLPGDYFGGADLQKAVLKHLHPVYKGNHFHVAKRRRTVASLAHAFADVYRELSVQTCATDACSITTRAAFENRPIDALYCYSLYERLNKVIARYKATGNAAYISAEIDKTIARSLRNVDKAPYHSS